MDFPSPKTTNSLLDLPDPEEETPWYDIFVYNEIHDWHVLDAFLQDPYQACDSHQNFPFLQRQLNANLNIAILARCIHDTKFS
jgi:hypothetical protein